MTDVLDFVLKVFEETAPLGDNFMAQLEQTTRMCIEPCLTIAGICLYSLRLFINIRNSGSSKRDPYHPVSENSMLLDIITLLDTHNLHRVPVCSIKFDNQYLMNCTGGRSNRTDSQFNYSGWSFEMVRV